MLVKDVMTRDAQYIPVGSILKQAAEKMRELDTGFLPIGDAKEDRLQGVITDRDIVIRALADGLDPNTITVEQMKTDKVLYCYENDDIEAAAQSMRDQQVYRLIVLNNPEQKRLWGVVTLGDIHRHDQDRLAGETAGAISAAL